MRPHATHKHTTQTRDAALRKLRRVNRWMIAASILLTGVLSDIAAHAFPGKTKATAKSSKSAGRTKSSSGGSSSGGTSTTSSRSLKPPAQAPQAATGATSSRQSTTAQKSTSAPESASSQESSAEATPAQESSAPVVSGGS